MGIDHVSELSGAARMVTSPGSEIPSHRACAHCRSQKVRCLPEDGNPDVCQRCARAGRQCVFTPLQKRKQRKRTDTRVAELEREMRAMRSMLKKKQEKAAGSSATTPEEEHNTHPRPPRSIWFAQNADNSEAIPNGNVPAHTVATSRPTTATSDVDYMSSTVVPLWPTRYHEIRPPQPQLDDIVERGIISMATARLLFQTYCDDLFPHYPIVAIPDNMTADEMRKTRPTLFLAIIAAAAGKENSGLAVVLDQDVLRAYATRSLVRSEKSLELVQALLISSLWYHPPQKFGQLKYYEYIHMAASMAIDLGIGTRPASHRRRPRRNSSSTSDVHTRVQTITDDTHSSAVNHASPTRATSPDPASLESRRTLVGCYIICAGVSVSLRRPNMLRASNYMRESADYLERSHAALPTDRTLAAWLKLMIIADEIGASFSYDDLGDVASLGELRTQIMLKDFRSKLEAWYNGTAPELMTGSLRIMYHTVRLYLHEIALHVEHSPDDFRAPYQMSQILPPEDEIDVPTAILAETIAQCIQSAHDLLGTFVSIDPNSLRALPVFSFVRVSFGAFVLAKLTLSMVTPNSRIGQIIDRNQLQASEHIERTIEHARAVIRTDKCRVPTIFLALLLKVRQWCRQPELLAHMMMSEENACLLPPHGDVPTFESHARQLVEASRIEEQPSSGETSPREHGVYPSLQSASMNGSNPQSDWQKSTQGGPPPLTRQESDSSLVDGNAMNMPNFGLNVESSYLPDNGMYVPTNDEMQLDPELMQLWSEMNAGGVNNGFPEGGLTGLDDWALPMQMMVGAGGVTNNDGFDWTQNEAPNASNGNGTDFVR